GSTSCEIRTESPREPHRAKPCVARGGGDSPGADPAPAGLALRGGPCLPAVRRVLVSRAPRRRHGLRTVFRGRGPRSIHSGGAAGLGGQRTAPRGDTRRGARARPGGGTESLGRRCGPTGSPPEVLTECVSSATTGLWSLSTVQRDPVATRQDASRSLQAE